MPARSPTTQPVDSSSLEALPDLLPLTPEEVGERMGIIALAPSGRMQPRDFARLKELDERATAHGQLPTP
jgi:hypothetical protein